MRILLAAAAIAAFATPALADTLQEVTTKGVILTIQGQDIDVTYTPDGKFTAAGGQIAGEWRIDGDKLCTKSAVQPEERCTAYPAGKKSGDTFQLTGGPLGDVTIKIN